MNPFGLPGQQWASVLDYAEEVREGAKEGALVLVKGKKGSKGKDDRWVPRTHDRGGMSVNFDEEGVGHVRGGNYDPARASFGYTKDEAVKVRSMLRGFGVAVSIAEAEGYLSCALFVLDGGTLAGYSSAVASIAERVAKYRAGLAEGRCRTCGGACEGERRYCLGCMRSANERQKRARAARRLA